MGDSLQWGAQQELLEGEVSEIVSCSTRTHSGERESCRLQ